VSLTTLLVSTYRRQLEVTVWSEEWNDGPAPHLEAGKLRRLQCHARWRCLQIGVFQGSVATNEAWWWMSYSHYSTMRTIRMEGSADNLALLITGNFPSTVSDLMRRLPDTAQSWCRSEKLSVNFDKKELVVFHSLTPWHYSPDGRKPPLIRFHSLI
jgi:hypothetical protein